MADNYLEKQYEANTRSTKITKNTSQIKWQHFQWICSISSYKPDYKGLPEDGLLQMLF